MIGAITNHLWQSTVFAAAVALLASAFRKNRAEVRYWLWLSASLKFLIPFALLLSFGARLWDFLPAEKIPAPVASSTVSQTVVQIARPFPDTFAYAPAARHAITWVPIALLAIWAVGFLAIAIMRIRGWLRIRAALRASTPANIRFEVPATFPVRFCPGLLEPGVVGFLNPVLLLPEGITKSLDPSQLEAVLAHEQSHVRRRDNLTSALHMLVEAVFWFHPLVWWIGAKLVEERERACDESVLARGNEPRVYAEGILNVCKSYLESPLRCVSGVTGSDLKKRIRAILTQRVARDLNFTRKAALAVAAVAALAVPILVGVIGAPSLRAQAQIQQSTSHSFEFEVVSVKPAKPGQVGMSMDALGPGRVSDTFSATNIPLIAYIREAYGMTFGSEDGRVSGAPAWVNSERYDIEAKMDPSVVDSLNRLSPGERELEMHHMLQTVLADRFGLVVHRETKELPVYSLVVAKNGPKLREAQPEDSARSGMGLKGRGGPLVGRAVPMPVLAEQLSSLLNRIVLDKTGLTGKYNFTMQWTPDEGQGPNYIKDPGSTANGPTGPASQDANGPSIFNALQDQLGLKLESGKGPVEIIVIDHVERPTGN
jgi:bla regulator protein BlaR1